MQIEGFSISPQQARLWSLHERGPFRAVAALSLKGSLDKDCLNKSLAWLSANHEMLRTAFVTPAGLKLPLQVISDEAGVESVPSQERSWEDLVTQEIQAPVKPEETNRARVIQVEAAPDHHVLIFSLPSLCCDGWNLNRLAAELGALYQTLSNGQEPDDEPVQYTDYADWLEELEEEQEGAHLFWDQQLAALPDTQPLARFQDRWETGFISARLPLPATPLQGPQQAAKHWGASTRNWWLTCWLTLLGRFGNLTQSPCAVAFHGRSFDELETSFGPFTRFTPFVAAIPANGTFGHAVKTVDAVSQRFQDRQDFFKPGQDGPATAFEWQNQPAPFQADNLTFEVCDQYQISEPFACRLLVVETPEGFQSELIYNAAHFSESFMKQLGEQLGILLRDAAANPDKTVGELVTLPPTERARLLEPGEPQGVLLHDPVHRLFEARVAQYPERTALVYQGPDPSEPLQKLTFKELNERANRLAHRLQFLGAGPDQPVAICLGRGVDLMVSMLAALKSGGGYIPMDPGTPEARLSFMIEDSGAAVLITDSNHNELQTGVPRVILPQDQESINVLDAHNLDVRMHPNNLAYGIYTSGSTGQPKAVGVEHGNLLHYVNGVCAALALEDQSYAVVSTIAADLGNTSVFPALCLGGTLHLLSGEHITDGHRFGHYFTEHGVDCLKITPSHLASLMSMGDGARVLPRKKLILGGEATRPQLLEEITRLAPDLEIYNHYGPSETTIGTLTYRHKGGDGFPMGRPLPSSAVHLLTAQLEPVPQGAPGEVYIAGPGVTRGYVNKPGLTADRFIPNPFQGEPGARMYRAGDLARRDADDNLIFMGRVDHQVKLRGFRIELGEIEALLRTMDAISDAVVLLKTGASGDDRLVAYVEGGERVQDLNPHQIRGFLTERLSDYMVPAAYVILEKFPLNPNGKMDRKALPEPVASSADHAEYVAPATETETLIAQIWKDLLETDRIGSQDQFFELGGHSFLAIRTLAALKDRTGLDLEVRTLLENPKLADFAAAVDAAGSKAPAEREAFNPENLNFPLAVRSLELDGETRRLWFGDPDAIRPLITDDCPVDQLPHYILKNNDLEVFDRAEDKQAAAIKLLGLEPAPEDPQELANLFQDRVGSVREALNQAWSAGEEKDRYMAGHHPSWFVKRGIRTLNMAEFEGRRGASSKRVLDGVNSFIKKQGLLRAVLTREEEERFFFKEMAEVKLCQIPEFDLSGYRPQTQAKCLEVLHYMLGQDLLKAEPPLDTILYNVVLIRTDHTRYRVLFVMDHIIADYEAKHVVRRYLQYLDQSARATPPEGEVEHYRSFPQIQAPPPDGDPKFDQVKEHPYFVKYRDPVLEMQKKHPIGEPIVFSKPVHLEVQLASMTSDSEDNYLGVGLATAGQIIRSLFNLPAAPIRVLVSRRYFSGYNFYNTIGDFHDSVPVLIPSELTDPDECFGELRRTDQSYADAGLDLSSLGREPDIYHAVYKSPVNFNFVGEISEQHEAGMLASAGVFSFVSYPVFAYHVGNKLGLIFYHGMDDATAAAVETWLQTQPNPYKLNSLKGRDQEPPK